MLPTPALDLTSTTSDGGERGLLSVTFHPDYDTNGHVFTNHTDNQGNTRLSETVFEVVPDTTQPIVQFTDPPFDFDVTEGSTLTLGVRGTDNVLVRRLELFAALQEGDLEAWAL